MGKPATGFQKKWPGVWIRKEDSLEVFAILDQRPSQCTPGDVVARLVRRYGKAEMAEMRKELAAELKEATSAARRPSKSAKELSAEGPA